MSHHSEFKPVVTKAALAFQNKKNEFRAIVFEEGSEPVADTVCYKKTKEIKKTNDVVHEEHDFDIKRARHEILNFAMNNQRVQKNQKKMIIHQLVKLGAKPPKKAYRNYKELIDERKRLKDIREERKKFHKLGKNQTGAASVKCRSKTKLEKQHRKRLPVAAIEQHYGVVKPKLKKKK